MTIVMEVRSEDRPVPERFDYWHELAVNAAVSTIISSDHRDDFRATSRRLDLGTARVSAMTYPSLHARRAPTLIRRSDPEWYEMSLALRGAQRVAQVGRDSSHGPRNLVIYDSSRPFDHQLIAAGGGDVALVVVQVPRARFPVPADSVDRLLALGISTHTGVGALLEQFLVRLTVDAHHYREADAPRLETVLLDLFAATLAHELDVDDVVPPEFRQRALLLRIKAFIHQRIGDPRLSPAVVAAAHHISTRHLHRVFQDQDTTVAAWIRTQRLEACRRDLADPALCLTSIRELAARRGFGDPVVFSRTFRNAFGCSPRDYRQHALAAEADRAGRSGDRPSSPGRTSRG
jgi:AraC-like DNA-binding protein